MMVVMTPISVTNNKPARSNRKINYRPLSEQGFQKMKQWIENENWKILTTESSADKKMDIIQQLLVTKYHEFFQKKVDSFPVMMSLTILKN